MRDLIESFAVGWGGSRVLVVAADADRISKRLLSEYSAASVDHFDQLELTGTPAAERIYDVAVIGDLLFRLTPTATLNTLRWLRDHLRPGGECLVESRTYLAPDGGALGEHIRTPYAHLAFAREAIEDYYSAQRWGKPPETNVMCRATYLVVMRLAGFAIEEVNTEERAPELFADKLRWYDPAELRVGVLRVRLRRPRDTGAALDELTAALKAK